MSAEDLQQHHLYSASGYEGWFNCAGKIAMEQGLKDSYSPYADEGSAAHYLLAECLTRNAAPGEFLGRTIICWEKQGDRDGQCFTDTPLPKEAVERSRWEVTAEMRDHIASVIDTVRIVVSDADLFIEQRVEFGTVIGLPGAFGTTDIGALAKDDSTLFVIDLKYGHKTVEAEGNGQLQLYAIGLLNLLRGIVDPKKLKHIHIRIAQPRTNNSSCWIINPQELMAFAEKAAQAVERSEQARADLMAGMDLDVWQNSYLNVSEKGCQWCKAKAACPAFLKEAIVTSLSVLPADDDDLLDLDAPVAEQVTSLATIAEQAVERIPRIDFDTLAKVYGAIGKLEVFCEGVRTRMLHDMLQGDKHPDWKLVKGREGNRRWSDPEAVATTCKAFKMLVDEIYDKSVKSPPELEKLLKKEQPKRWAKLETFITRKEASISVAPVTDKRLAVDPPGASLDLLPDLDLPI